MIIFCLQVLNTPLYSFNWMQYSSYFVVLCSIVVLSLKTAAFHFRGGCISVVHIVFGTIVFKGRFYSDCVKMTLSFSSALFFLYISDSYLLTLVPRVWPMQFFGTDDFCTSRKRNSLTFKSQDVCASLAMKKKIASLDLYTEQIHPENH